MSLIKPDVNSFQSYTRQISGNSHFARIYIGRSFPLPERCRLCLRKIRSERPAVQCSVELFSPCSTRTCSTDTAQRRPALRRHSFRCSSSSSPHVLLLQDRASFRQCQSETTLLADNLQWPPPPAKAANTVVPLPLRRGRSVRWTLATPLVPIVRHRRKP